MMEVTASADPFARHAIALMKEFGSKLMECKERVEENVREAAQARSLAIPGAKAKEPHTFVNKHVELSQEFEKLKPEMLSIARIVSQKLEHSEFDDLTRLELKLRLREFEKTINGTSQAMSTWPS